MREEIAGCDNSRNGALVYPISWLLNLLFDVSATVNYIFVTIKACEPFSFADSVYT